MINGKLTFIDLFAGIGGFRYGMELAGHKCVGFCEWDKCATASYTSMHLITEEQRDYLKTLNLKKRQKEILKDEYRNGEWYSDDIRNVDAGSVPKCDCWCFGAPCQDFSIAGRREGLNGSRSSLIREVFRILGEIREEDRPKWIIYENVKGMFSSNKGFDFLKILLAMDELGYDMEWQIINSKDWGVPQNRERVYTVGHLRRFGTRKIFPLAGKNEENSIRKLGNYIPTATSETSNSRAIQERYYKGFCRHKTEMSRVIIPVLTPDRIKKHQNGRRLKENGDPMFTLTAQDRNGVGIGMEPVGGIYTNASPNFQHGIYANCFRCVKANKTDSGVALKVKGQAAGELDQDCNQGIFVKISERTTVYAIWYEKYKCYIAIRRMTPKECFRLQGWEDTYFEKAAFVNCESQLYKQAGNGVTVNVVYQIGRAMRQRVPAKDAEKETM